VTRFRSRSAVVATALAAAFVFVGFGAPAQAAPVHPSAVAMPMGCGDVSMAAYGPIGGHWSRTYSGRCGHIDQKNKPTIGMAWEVKARGYRWSDGKPYWVSLGCGSGGHGTVHWGQTGHEIIGTTAVKALSENIVLGAPVYFTD
jgi:hypothetical protein